MPICPGFIHTPELDHYLAQKPDPESAWTEVVAYHPIGASDNQLKWLRLLSSLPPMRHRSSLEPISR